jgi:hypothetical protein
VSLSRRSGSAWGAGSRLLDALLSGLRNFVRRRPQPNAALRAITGRGTLSLRAPQPRHAASGGQLNQAGRSGPLITTSRWSTRGC